MEAINLSMGVDAGEFLDQLPIQVDASTVPTARPDPQCKHTTAHFPTVAIDGEDDEYLAMGYPIYSGVIEGVCRHLVKDRMERSGMRWSLEGARNMLHVRATYQSDYRNQFHDERKAKIMIRTHTNRSLVAPYKPSTLAC